MAIRFEGSEVQTDGDVRDILERIRKDPRTENPRVLVVLQERQMQARNGGYPIFMHHDTLAPARVENEKEEGALTGAGFRREYKHKSYPCFLFRRNMHPKFAKSQEERTRIGAMSPDAQRIEYATINEGDFIEAVQVNDQEAAEKMLALAPNKAAGIGKWHRKVTDVEPFEQGPEEAPEITIANLKGQIAALEAQASERRGPGRPRKDETAA